MFAPKLRFLLSVLFVLCLFAPPLQAAPPASTPYEKIAIVGETTLNGVYDPAIEYDGQVGWMVYTAVVFESYHYTHLAKTMDGGQTWTYVSRLNDSFDDTVVVDGAAVAGLWRNEVPTLLYDANDPDPNKRWKMFWHKYFTRDPQTPADRMFDYGWIAYKYANTPENLAEAEEVRLFGASPYPRDPSTGSTGYAVDHHLNQLDPSLQGYLYFSEPGSLVQNGVLYLSFDASTSIRGMYEWQERKTLLIASSDHGDTWHYAGVLTDFSDALQFNYVVLTATALADVDGRAHLIATPSGSLANPDHTGHDGLYIFKFRDLAQAQLQRDKKGKLVVTKYLEPFSEAAAGGPGDYDAGSTHGGVVMGNIVIQGHDVFQIYNTKYHINASAGGSSGKRNK